MQALDHEHKGIWIDLIVIMWDTSERGRLVLPDGSPMPDVAVARNLGISEAEWKQKRSTILAYGVASVDEAGTLYCRRMVRDEATRMQKVEAGRAGGKVSRPPSTPLSKSEANGGSTAGKMKMKNEVEEQLEKDAFETFWIAYPKRSGGNPRAKALTRWRSNVKRGVESAEMESGAARYAEYCFATKKTGTEYVQQAQTFLGQNEGWKEPWDIPPPEVAKIDEDQRDADRRAEARSRQSRKALEQADAEAQKATQEHDRLRATYDALTKAQKTAVGQDATARARKIQPVGELPDVLMKACLAQVVKEIE